ncbi:MAG: MucB/RseB C-terminal domain-containing protein [Gammaproteobacteria bacterium]|nr:MucB/RseB C-terminal domain-containing protein [Gammaproteobacteria bacterium]
MRRAHRCSALFLLLLTASAAHATEDATRWLERMSQAAHSLSYEGTFVYMQEGRLESLQLVHAVDATGEHERLVSLSGPYREVIRDHGRVTCYLPEKEALVAGQPATPPRFPLNLPTQWEQLRSVYDFELLGLSRVAGLAAQRLAIVPRDELRYGQHYWIAVDSGLLLRADTLNEHGELVEQLEFTSLKLMEQIPAQLLQPEAGGRAIELPPGFSATAAERPAPLHWHVTRLPAGFELELQRQHAIADDGVVVDHLVYSDGLASVSVFIEPRRDPAEESAGTSRRGSVNAYTRLLPQQRITVLGEVPLATVRQIGESIEPLGQ